MAKLGFSVRSLTSALVLALLVSAPPRGAHAQEAISEEAKLYFKNGVELIQAQPPNYQDAYYQFKLAWEKSKSWKVLSNWGLCALKLERDGEAIWAYTEYLKQKDIDPEERRDLERDLLLLNGNAASVTINSDVPDLEVVDARGGSSVPPQSYRLEQGTLTLRLRAGSHAITASSQGKTQRWDVTLSPGKKDEHRFEFGAAPAPVVAAGATTTADSVQSPEPGAGESGGTLRTVGYVVAGAGVLALGGGAFMGLSAKSQETEARDQCRNVPLLGFSCPESVRADFDKAQQNARLANVLMIAGGVVAAGGIVMVVVGGPKRREQPASATLSLSPVVGPRDAALFATGTF